MKNRVSILAGTLLIMLLVSACSTHQVASSSDTSASQSDSNKSRYAADSDRSSAAQQAFEPGAGPILAHLTSNVIDSLEQVNPSTGTIKTVFKANITDGVDAKPTFDLSRRSVHMSGWYKAQVFDPSLQRMAVNWTVNSDGSHHVGWVNKDGTLTDVTAQLSNGASNFSARPQDYNALFDAQGNFIYADTSTGLVNRLNPDTMASVGNPFNVKNLYGNIPYVIMFQGDGSVDTYSSDRLYDTGLVFDLKMPSGISITSFSKASIEDVIDKNNVLVLNAGGLKVMGPKNLKEDHKGYYNTEDGTNIPAITPTTDFRYENATVSGDGKQVAFVANRGQERDLFVVPIDGSSGPKKLVQLNNDTILLFWI